MIQNHIQINPVEKSHIDQVKSKAQFAKHPKNISVHYHLKIAKSYILGTGSIFDYNAAIDHLEIITCQPYIRIPNQKLFLYDLDDNLLYSNLAQYQADYEIFKDVMPRLKVLKNHGIDDLLNNLREVALDTKYHSLLKLFEIIYNSSEKFVTSKNDFYSDCIAFKKKTHAAITTFFEENPNFKNFNEGTELLKILSFVVSVCSLGIANLVSGRNIYGLFSLKIDTEVRLSDLLENTSSNTYGRAI